MVLAALGTDICIRESDDHKDKIGHKDILL